MHTFKNATLGVLSVIMGMALSLEASAQGVKATIPTCLPSATLEQLPQAFDAALSGPGDKDRTCLRQLLMPDMRIVLMVRVAEGVLAPHSVTVNEWINAVSKRGEESLYEHEVRVHTETFGRIAHLWCTYELRPTPDGRATSRGIVSVEAVFDGKNWKLAEVSWQPERSDEPIPAEYLP